jgi:two-component system, OmpR family, sensor histidine kinase MtrB
VTISPRALRSRISLAFTLGALLLSTTLATFTFLVARGFLVDQRENEAVRSAYTSSASLRSRLTVPDSPIKDELGEASKPPSGGIVLFQNGKWYSTTLGQDSTILPQPLQEQVSRQEPGYVLTQVDDKPTIIVGIPLSEDIQYYWVDQLTDLGGALAALTLVLSIGTVLATGGGAALGMWASRKTIQPLNLVTQTAAKIAGGNLNSRLPNTSDPDLFALIASFNSMVDTLQQRLERDTRFAADVGHELRSPLTTLVGSVELLERDRDRLPARAGQAVELIAGDLTRLQGLLNNLVHLAKTDAGIDLDDAPVLDLAEMISQVLSRSEHSPDQLDVLDSGMVRGDKLLLEQALINLIDNADRHGGGLSAVTVRPDEDALLVLVDDDGPGVPMNDRERIFDRFATSKSSRGSSSGTGLGLALASQTFSAHGGALWYTESPSGGARFVARLPKVEP